MKGISYKGGWRCHQFNFLRFNFTRVINVTSARSVVSWLGPRDTCVRVVRVAVTLNCGVIRKIHCFNWFPRNKILLINERISYYEITLKKKYLHKCKSAMFMSLHVFEYSKRNRCVFVTLFSDIGSRSKNTADRTRINFDTLV